MRILPAIALMCLVTLPAVAQDLKADLMAIEHNLWTAWGKKDGALFQKHLTEDAVQLIAGAAPVEGRDAIVKAITMLPCELRSFNLEQAALRQVNPDVVILSYTATQDSSCEGKKLPAKLRATALYLRQKGTWRQANYQETPIQ